MRKAALCNIELTPATIPHVVERLRDVDPNIRKYVFRKSLVEIGDMRVFGIDDRERILELGLRDRDAGVRKACTEMLLNGWVKQCDDNIIEVIVEDRT